MVCGAGRALGDAGGSVDDGGLSGLYCYGNQPGACYWNLEQLAVALEGVVDDKTMEAGLAQYQPKYAEVFCDRTLKKLGFSSHQLAPETARELLSQTLTLLEETRVSYPDFFLSLTQQFDRSWRTDETLILSATLENSDPAAAELLQQWRKIYQYCLSQLPIENMDNVQACLRATNPKTVLLRPQIEAIWQPITEADNWQPFYDLLKKIQNPTEANVR